MQDNNKLEIARLLKIEGIEQKQIYKMIIIPPNNEMGDYALPCFQFAKIMRKSPKLIAEELAKELGDKIKPPLKKVEAVNGYLNFFVDKLFIGQSLLSEIIEKGCGYGDSVIGEGKTICIDYSSINIAKPFHI